MFDSVGSDSRDENSTDTSYYPSASSQLFMSRTVLVLTVTRAPAEDLSEASNADSTSEYHSDESDLSEHYVYCGAPIADHAFLEDYHSEYWHPHMSHDIGRRLDFVNDKVRLWLSKWGGVNNWHKGIPQDQLRKQQEVGLELLFDLNCAMDGDVDAIPRFELRSTFLFTIQIMEQLGGGLGLLECLLRD